VSIRIASYNVHEYVGTDRRRSEERILEVLRELRADVLLLQEIRNTEARENEPVVDWFSRELGMHAFLGPTLMREDADYGNACLAKCQPAAWQQHELSVPGREPRGAIDLRFGEDLASLRLVATHLGLRRAERRYQYGRLGEILAAQNAPLTVLGGDFNDLRSPASLRGVSLGQPSDSRISTFPARWPLLPLDRIHVWPRECLGRLHAVRSRLTRSASDHLPLVAEIHPERSGRRAPV